MGEASIAPAAIGATSYTVSAAQGFIVELNLVIQPFSPGAFDVSYPSGASGLHIRLVKDDARLDLLTLQAPDETTFNRRRILVNSMPLDTETTLLSCQIYPLAQASPLESWRVEVVGETAAVYQLRQAQNTESAPSVALLLCDPVADFNFGADVTLSEGVGSVNEGGTVLLTAREATGEHNLVKTQTAPAPKIIYRWSAESELPLDGFPACGEARTLSFIAPQVDKPHQLTLKLDVWVEGECPSEAGLLNASAEHSLIIEPGAQLTVGPENSCGVVPWRTTDVDYLFDSEHSLIVVWSGEGIQATRFNPFDNSATAPPLTTIKITDLEYRVRGGAVILPDDDLLVPYIETKLKYSLQGEVLHSTVAYKRAAFDKLSAQTEKTIISSSDVWYADVFVIISGQIATFFYHLVGENSIDSSGIEPLHLTSNFFCWRYDYLTGAEVSHTSLNTISADSSLSHAASDAQERVWLVNLVKQKSGPLEVMMLNRAVFQPSSGTETDRDVEVDLSSEYPFVLPSHSGDAWVFWKTDDGLSYRRYSEQSGYWQEQEAEQLPHLLAQESRPRAVEDNSGGVILFWNALRPDGESPHIYFTRRSLGSNLWSSPQLLTEDGVLEHVYKTPDASVRVFYTRPKSNTERSLFFSDIIQARLS